MQDEKTLYFDENYRQYDSWYDEHAREYEDQVEFIRSILPPGKGIEIGVGTGRFASRLGIGSGVDLSGRMVGIARGRGIDAIVANAENMPFGDGEFDFSLNMVTICFLDNPLASIREARRISRIAVTVILDRESEYVQEMMKKESGFYRYARFYTGGEIVDLYAKAGFREITVREEDLVTSDGKKYRLVGVVGE